MSNVSFYIPEQLNLEKMLPNANPKEIDKLHYLINLIYQQRANYAIDSEYVPLKALYLRKILRDHKPYRSLLEDLGIIKCDYQYIIDKKSYGLKLNEPYKSMQVKSVKCKSSRISKRIETFYENKIPLKEIHKFLKDKLEIVEIDYDKACMAIVNDPIEKYNSNLISISKINNKEWHFRVDEFKRVHTNLTILSSKLRKYITVNGKSLVNIDIANSQPLFLDHVISSTNTRSEYPKGIYYTIRCAEIDPFSDLVQNGQLYDFLVDYHAKNGNYINKSEVKHLVFKDMFGPTTSDTFCSLFPETGNALKKLKEKDYREVAWKMQREESNLVINTICEKIRQVMPNEFIATIHDSILTTENCVDNILTIMNDAFAGIKLHPTLRVENYDQ